MLYYISKTIKSTNLKLNYGDFIFPKTSLYIVLMVYTSRAYFCDVSNMVLYYLKVKFDQILTKTSGFFTFFLAFLVLIICSDLWHSYLHYLTI